MASIEMLRPENANAEQPSYVPTVVQATILSGSEGSTPTDDVLLEPTGIIRVKVRSHPDYSKDYYARIFGEFYRVIGMRKVAPNGLFTEMLLGSVDDVLKIADFLSIGGKRLTIKGQEVTI